MERRHLFDNGYPVASATLVAGSEVLVAIAHQSVSKSTLRLASSLLLLADSSGRLLHSLARCGSSHAELRETRDNHVYREPDRPSEKAARHEPQDRPPRAQPHHR